MWPILQRELIRGARDPAFLLVRWLTALGGMLLLVFVVSIIEEVPGRVGLVVFHWFHYLWGAMLLGLGVWLTLPTLVTEREEGTLGLLFMTRLKPFEVVMGKGMGIALRAGVLWLTAVPVSMVPLVMGAVSAVDLILCTAIDFALLSSGLSVGLLFSASARNPDAARRGGWGIALSVGVLVLGGLGFVRSVFSRLPQIAIDILCILYGFGFGLLVALVAVVSAGIILTRRWNELESPPPPLKDGEEPDWIEVEEEAWREAWRVGPGRRLRARWPLGWLRLREAGQVETFWIWPLVVLGFWIAAYIGGKPVLAVVAGGSVALGLSIQSASGYRQEIRSGALELLMTTPVRTASYFLNRVCLGLREFGLALLLHGVLSVLAIWVWGSIGQPYDGGWPWMPTLRPELLLWPLLAVFASPAAGLLTSARLANLPAAIACSVVLGLLFPTLGGVAHSWLGWSRAPVACLMGAYLVQAAWMIHAVIRELHSREFAVRQMRPS
jgi:hypothetical protein